LPYSLTNANLNAIWLGENQSTGKIKLQPDFDEETQKEVLTCYLLPQQNFKTPSMENLLQGSINTAENASQPSPVVRANVESVRFAENDVDEGPSHFVRVNTPHPKDLIKKKEAIKQRVVNKEKEPDSEQKISVEQQQQLPVISTRFSQNHNPDSTNRSNTNNAGDSYASTSSQKIITSMAKINNRQSIASDEGGLSKNNDNTDYNINSNKNVNCDSNTSNSCVQQIGGDKKINFHSKAEIISKKATFSEVIASSTTNHVNKHVDFKLNERTVVINSIEDEDEEIDDIEEEEVQPDALTCETADESEQINSSGHFKLRRRDTPHHLKGARLNSPKAQCLDPNEIKEILEKYTTAKIGSSPASSISPNYTNCNKALTSASPDTGNMVVDLQSKTHSSFKIQPALRFIPENLKYQELKKLIQLIIKIQRQEGTGLGIRIAGGKGSNPYKEDDDGIFITRILPESPARTTGLKVGDKLVKVNNTCLNDLTHQQAADTLKEAVKSDNQLVLSVLQEIDMNKLFFLEIPRGETGMVNETCPYGFRINHNFNTHQQREVEIITIVDHHRYGQLCKGDILLQINGLNVDSISEKDLNRFVQNSSIADANEFEIKYLTLYRPYIEMEEVNGCDDESLATSVSDAASEAKLNGSISKGKLK